MKKLIALLLLLILGAGTVLAARTYDWNPRATTTEAQYLYCPSTGIFREVGASAVRFYIAEGSTLESYGIQYFQSNGTVEVKSNTVTPEIENALLSPFFRLYILTSTVDASVVGTGEVYIK
jgi:hypothetical protein